MVDFAFIVDMLKIISIKMNRLLRSKNRSTIFLVFTLASMLAGAIAGIFTGTIHTRLKVHPLLAGIIVMTGLYSINLAILGRPNQPLINIDNLLMSPSTNSDHSSIILFVFSVVLISLINAS